MKLEIKRRIFTDTSTVGSFFIDGERICDSLEDCDRFLEVDGKAAKIPGKTAIPRGEYKVEITWSNRFSKYMMQVMDVPHFDGIRIHAGNTSADTEGCPLLGNAVDEWTVVNSRVNVQKVFDRVKRALDAKENVHLVIS